MLAQVVGPLIPAEELSFKLLTPGSILTDTPVWRINQQKGYGSVSPSLSSPPVSAIKIRKNNNRKELLLLRHYF